MQDDFEKDGVVVVPGFASPEEVKGMKDRMAELIATWDPSESKVESPNSPFACLPFISV